MARFNTAAPSLSVTGAIVFTYAFTSGLITLSGTSGYTVTLASPVAVPGTVQTFYNATGGNVTISTPNGNIIGNGLTAATSQTLPNVSTFGLQSDGTNYVLTDNQGGPVAVTTFTASGNISAITSNQTVTLSPTGTGTVTISPAGATTLGTASITTNLYGNISAITSNQTVTLSPTGTGTVTISPAGAVTIAPTTVGSINNINIGASTRGSGAFSTLGANSTVTFTGAISADTGTNNQSITTTGAGTITITSGTTGNINNMNIGATTAGTGRFSTVTSTIATGTAPFTVTSTTNVANLNASSLNGATFAAPGSIGSTTASSGAFSSLSANNGLTVSAGTSTFSAAVSVPTPTAGGHAANKTYVDAANPTPTKAISSYVTFYTTGVYTGLVSTEVDGAVSRSNFTYDTQKRVTSYSELYNSVTKTVTITYAAAGGISTVTAV
jgi:hypothetical protein